MYKITRKAESGRSMLEIIGVLAIMTIMSAGAFVMIRSAMATQRRNTVMDDFSKIVTGVRTLFADYDNLKDWTSGDDVLAAMAIDDNGPYSGSKYAVTVDKTDASFQTFRVSITHVPDRDCIVLAKKSWPGAVKNSVKYNCNGTGFVNVAYTK